MDRIVPPSLGFGARAFIALQHVLPQHAISRLVLRATRSTAPGFKNLLIGAVLFLTLKALGLLLV